MIGNVAGREGTRLNGRWRSIVDPYETGYLSFRGEAWEHGWFRNYDLRPGLAEYDWDRADLLDVPGDWNSQDPRLWLYEGTVWYKTDFDAPAAPGRRRFLHFGAANYWAVVYLNGEKLGEHVGGFTPFAFEITDRVVERDNFVVVKVDNQRRREGVPTLSTDWWNYGGLTRDVSIVEVPATFVRDYSIQLEPGDAGRICGWVQLEGSEARQSVAVRIPGADLETVVTTDDAGLARVELEGRVELWSPERPRLYDVEIEAETDRVEDRIGFRTVETRGADILLNGEPVFLRGISIHEEAPTRPGRAFGEEDARVLLGWAKELGCNFVRLAHYTHDEATVRLADELGLLVWAETPVYWRIAWDNPETLALARQQLREMIERDRNRASVVLWSVGNETQEDDARLSFQADLAALARELDPTRLVTAALMARPVEGKTMQLDDPLVEHLDVMGCNEYLGWYYVKPDAVPEYEWASSQDKPLIMSELGAGALQGRHGDRETLFTEENQAWVYAQQIEMLRRIPFLRGLSPWILKDFRSPNRPLKGIQDYWNRKGLISDRGQRKLAFDVLRRFYAELAGKSTAAARKEP